MIGDRLVARRECGECIACCQYFTIDAPELKKLPGELCPHHTQESGCGIYERRPTACRDWYCGWRLLPQFDDSWRPDRMQVTIEFRPAPPGYAGPAIGFRLLGNLKVVLDPRFVDAVCAFVATGVPVFLFVPGTVGQLSGKVFLNDGLAPSVSAGDVTETRRQLLLALEAGLRHQKERVTFMPASHGTAPSPLRASPIGSDGAPPSPATNEEGAAASQPLHFFGAPGRI